ncbi:hypothetical protein O0L34_g88 [Tuta absoluta]|nr:hypothetical protein O0L34_g88 [Tuta absoluta]
MENNKNPDAVRVLDTFGRFHAWHWFLVTIPSLVHTMSNINFVIVAGDMDYRCRIPECDATESTSTFPAWWPEWNTSIDKKCFKPILTHSFSRNDTCSNTSFTQDIERCTQWIYESNNTIVSELNLACEPVKINMVGVIHNMGLFCSLLIFGYLADRFGRKPMLIINATGVAIGLLKIVSVDYTMFVVVDFIEAFVAGGMYVSTSVMLIELSTKSSRVYGGIVIMSAICFGEILLGVLAIFFPYWKHLILLIYTPPLIFISYIFLAKESPRWQVLNGKMDAAKQTILNMAKANQIPIDKQELDAIDDDQLKAMFNIKKYEVKDGYKEIFQSKEITIRLIVGAACRFTSAFVYYGIIINSVYLPGDKNFNFFLSTLMTIPGMVIALYLMNRIGRRMPLIVGYALSGVMCIVSGYIPWTWGKVASFLVGKMLIAVCITGVATYCMELYPTSTRGTLLSFGFGTSRIGALLAPLTPLLVPISPALPPLLFGAMAVVSSLLLTLTPETKNMPLFETIEQVDKYTREAKETKKRAKGKKDLVQSSETIVSSL